MESKTILSPPLNGKKLIWRRDEGLHGKKFFRIEVRSSYPARIVEIRFSEVTFSVTNTSLAEKDNLNWTKENGCTPGAALCLTLRTRANGNGL